MHINIKLTKTKLALVVAAVALAGTSVAYAGHHPFTDVEDGKWYSDAVEWAYDNDITTGKTPTTFNGDDGVTRYEAVTFQQRYDENVAGPARDALADDISDNAADIADNADAISDNASAHDDEVGRLAYEQFTDEDNWDGNDLKTDVTIDVPTDGFLIVNYSANIGRDINESGTGDLTVTATFEHDGDTIDTFFQVIDLDAGLFNFDTHTLSFTHVLEASAGDNDVDVTLSHGGDADDLLYVYNENLNVLFVPFDASSGPIIVPLGAGDDGRNHNPNGNN
ncbi:MAG: S-layer homology domain-containing protein [Acidimicrobiales bacterium]|nr:S-layer homology domain-containing protein [Acidimicrobiales bacterium]